VQSPPAASHYVDEIESLNCQLPCSPAVGEAFDINPAYETKRLVRALPSRKIPFHNARHTRIDKDEEIEVLVLANNGVGYGKRRYPWKREGMTSIAESTVGMA
jgi:hypothetical protein